jgi:hypothetical protein
MFEPECLGESGGLAGDFRLSHRAIPGRVLLRAPRDVSDHLLPTTVLPNAIALM